MAERSALEAIRARLERADYGEHGVTRNDLRAQIPDLPEAIYLHLPDSKRLRSADEVLHEVRSSAWRAEGEFVGPKTSFPARGRKPITDRRPMAIRHWSALARSVPPPILRCPALTAIAWRRSKNTQRDRPARSCSGAPLCACTRSSRGLAHGRRPTLAMSIQVPSRRTRTTSAVTSLLVPSASLLLSSQLPRP